METITLNLYKYSIECKIKKVTNSLGDIILLIGATTFSGTYFLFSKYFKHHNLIIINTPGHGNSNGNAITNAEEYIEFYEDCILKLINSGYCSDKINLIGYSLGGMTLYHILKRKKLKTHINKSILLFSAYKVNHKTISTLKERLISNNKNTLLRITSKIFPRKLFLASIQSSIYDYALCESLNKLSASTDYNSLNNSNTSIIACNDLFFSTNDILITRHRLSATYINVSSSSHSSILTTPKKYVKLIEYCIMDMAIKKLIPN